MIDYSTQSYNTTLGDSVLSINTINSSPLSLARNCRNIIEHQSGVNSHNIPLSRHKDYELRTASEVLKEAYRRGLDLNSENPFEKKIIGNCQTISLLCLGIMRELGIPSRYRFCLCTYFKSGSYVEHIVIEYWCFSSNTWKVLDPTVTHEIIEKNKTSIDFDFDNIPKKKSNIFTDLWKNYRRGDLDIDELHHKSYKKIVGFERFVWRTLQDILALNKVELFYWDYFDFKKYVNDPTLVDVLIDNIDENKKKISNININFDGFTNLHPYQRDYK
ncbi:transglutaminase-like domain-containing protein [Photorhabdus temperata]|uniref:Transglutaminase-like superfamily protein n=1 Tax=Photorhabdus temperata subsp. temperata Meg1 TaxID=1393735 RepID=A0A081RWJ2_PHOTE|nr:transglutaminase domain-containing protein [Photorhabdus temperata]KER03045.1 Transglutaminase-like superfamily protein [Photorhabdus temperata subsp. temperata Meg1]MCT8347823.1 transglutaminase-like domain-containing protein [Photorhabdus temperata]